MLLLVHRGNELLQIKHWKH